MMMMMPFMADGASITAGLHCLLVNFIVNFLNCATNFRRLEHFGEKFIEIDCKFRGICSREAKIRRKKLQRFLLFHGDFSP